MTLWRQTDQLMFHAKQERDFIPSMSNFVDDEKEQVYDTSNFLLFSGTVRSFQSAFQIYLAFQSPLH